MSKKSETEILDLEKTLCIFAEKNGISKEIIQLFFKQEKLYE